MGAKSDKDAAYPIFAENCSSDLKLSILSKRFVDKSRQDKKMLNFVRLNTSLALVSEKLNECFKVFIVSYWQLGKCLLPLSCPSKNKGFGNTKVDP